MRASLALPPAAAVALLLCAALATTVDASIFHFTIVDPDNTQNNYEPLYPNSQVYIDLKCAPADMNSTFTMLVASSTSYDWISSALRGDCCTDSTDTQTCHAGFLIPKTAPAFSLIQSASYDCRPEPFTSTVLIASEADFVVSLYKRCLGTATLIGTTSYSGPYGYMDAREYPLLVIFGLLIGLHAVMLLVWIGLSIYHRRVLLKLQYIIGGVILLGLFETAIWCGYYSDFNQNGVRNTSLWNFASFMGSVKKTVALVFVLLVSLGYGVVQPALPPSTYLRVAGLGLALLVSNTAAAYQSSETGAKTASFQILMVPLALVYALFFTWILYSLHLVYRMLQVKKQELKLKMYRWLMISLVAVLALGLAGVLFEIYVNKTDADSRFWEMAWLRTALWHAMFFLTLLSISILWRPTSNNTRYAYTPLDQDDDDEEEQANPVPQAFGDIKLRAVNRSDPDDDDNIRWAEENLPSSSAMDRDFVPKVVSGMLDDDETRAEIANTRSKLQ
ncbi:hypothetical protein CAOG_05036 [Capsaspora owczarzaki ATCC 30864]|uniref:GOST seven transmembrane domain-containing protein n=1 Tax=Capsaspora owczarzaki (strain ATCC 30864) TaxID=595528 RepID=A0A0D2VT47_CAPO3|nr:hypothetical protein CAOG_05036 [Capsaspora owczarzaki ATCC 30864]KJE94392.1 hypothetical protein CAOG_005036 [Capsaspora owczarzaki ATCC 30864]|eukprot:XP_004346721.1 hypothetical protein CAOG_05036 [Capsaspora owczarzaki ATCC 30864]